MSRTILDKECTVGIDTQDLGSPQNLNLRCFQARHQPGAFLPEPIRIKPVTGGGLPGSQQLAPDVTIFIDNENPASVLLENIGSRETGHSAAHNNDLIVRFHRW